MRTKLSKCKVCIDIIKQEQKEVYAFVKNYLERRIIMP